MNSTAVAAAFFACIVVGTIAGAILRTRLSEDHLHPDSKDVIKMAVGLIATLSALVLGLLIATAKTSFDARSSQVREITSNIVLLDQLLAQYGSEANAARSELRLGLQFMVDRIWDENRAGEKNQNPFHASNEATTFIQGLSRLNGEDGFHRELKAKILQVTTEIARDRLTLYVQSSDTISMPFLIILSFWLMVIFAIFGLLARLNALVAFIMLLCAISVSAAIFLILDLNRPFEGLMQIPSGQIRNALPPLNG